MKKHLKLAFLLVLVGCANEGPVHSETTYTLPATPGGRLCVDQCKKSRDYCHQSCDLDARACYNDVQAAAQRDYDRYARQRFANRLRVDLLPSDFEHSEACEEEKKSCLASCARPYKVCFQDCGGSVTVTTSCQFMCFE